ncbi:disease resistance protein (TIR-NBS-LRR class) family protein [Arabidopsis thaliana]|uniref:ADP-ribosyl cyclase/cyclic ADP-ribose hydrolase n=1 Tax=Arabidopsis thaliana TaxID=3702 RepID=F4J910_ARATH|nr:disease resistance protein (TIR-NBS-LRR class) family protein [Arabidopsis thaliana]NP_001326498.1 disease resistance protein (TIR-NBS-LRR class) family protein [Arabidopsis thaliana]AEE77018.2 disease resistance protein (TIR-NBS-LRR class) family protein [Arabidopsis thaliana]ANM64473.1 disease resistance protein (TIR-NBS-LRR class) family protein [Arabidopsis thaliana]|eukprot:NP_001319642.1 disease resistance protein (TIR-NBS-LRR class) family protein [Arabidopsis thaliana]
MGAHMENMRALLRLDLDDVRMIGIWGPPGIGKTTIARFLLSQVSKSFQLSTIMVNIKECYPSPCLDEYSVQLQLQNKMLSKMINQKDIMIPHLGVAQERLKDKKVFLVLDDVDQLGQLDALAKETRWFGPGSRIIITTENLRLLMAHRINHIYKVEFSSTDEAFQIFCMHAFGQKHPYNGFYELSREVTELAGGLPLGLKVMGSSLRGMSKQEWKRTLPRLRTCLDGKIESILMFSYEALSHEDKDLFLCIACFFNYQKIKKVEKHLADRFLDVRQGLYVLAEKSLIHIGTGATEMHTLLVQLGREIAHTQSTNDPRKSLFLVDEREICEALSDETMDSSRRIIGMDFDLSKNGEEVTNISEKGLQRMSNLQFIRFDGRSCARHSSNLTVVRSSDNNCAHPDTVNALQDLNYQFQEIRLLHWINFRRLCLPSTFNPEFLVELNMPSSTCHTLWEGSKALRNLKWMDLSYSISLKELPDLSTATNLEELILKYCVSLVKVPSCVGKLGKLQVLCLHGCTSILELPSFTKNVTGLQSLDLNECSSLVELPSSIGNAINLQNLDLGCLRLLKLPLSIVKFTNLKKFILNGCSSLVELPFMGNATNLQNLDLGNCSSLVELPSSIGNAINLQNLDLSNCSSLVKLPSFIGNATNLEILDLRKCSSLVEIPTSIGHVTNLWRLDLSGCSSLVELPSSVGNISELQVLNLHNCSNLVKLPSSFGHATNLWRLDLSGCSSLVELPSSIGNITNLQELNLCNCSNLVKLPSSIGNLHLLFTLSLARCQKLEALPSNINLKSLERLDLTDCSQFKSFPEISTNIECLYLDGTAVEEVPSSIKSWSRLTVLHMSYFEKLKEFSHVLDIITWLEFGEDIQEVAPWIKEISRLHGLRLYKCRKLLSLPQLPESLSIINAEGCESLETLDCSYNNPLSLLNFAKCFKLNQEARDFIIQIPTSNDAVLPGAEVPAYFTHRATTGASLTIKLNERPISTSMRFKACIVLIKCDNDEAGDDGSSLMVHVDIMDKQNGLSVPYSPGIYTIYPLLTEHLYIFQGEAEEVTSTELMFEFETMSNKWDIGECGIILEVPSS